MRKITQQAINAFMLSEFQHFDKQNTSVIQYIDDNYKPKTRCLRLHGNDIARRKEGTNEIEISTAGWNTNTTKERLRAIPGVVNLSTVKGDMILNGKIWDGSWITL